MRIAWFTHRYHPVIGGAENYARAMAGRFAADGHEVDVFTTDARDLRYFTDRRRDRVEGPREERVDGVRVRRFPVRHHPGQRHLGRLLSYVPHWPTRCRRESFMPIVPGLDRVRGDYDAVFAVAFPYTIFAHAAHRTARAAGAPLVLTPFLHLSTPGDPVNRLYTRPHQARLLRESAAVVAVTDLEADAIVSMGVDRSRVLVLGMGVEHQAVTGGDPRALRNRLRIPRDGRVVGHLAALDANKGSVDLIRAVSALNEGRGDEPIGLVIAGAASPDFEAFFSSLPPDAARWLHRLPWPLEDRAEFYAALDVFAMPSRTDSYGIVFLEAWANGLPVVGAAAGGVAEVIRDGIDGHLVPFGDVPRLANRIAELADDPPHARELGARGREKVARGYSWDDRYQTLLGRTRSLVVPRRADLGHEANRGGPLTGGRDWTIVQQGTGDPTPPHGR